jgi:hypothetical protein
MSFGVDDPDWAGAGRVGCGLATAEEAGYFFEGALGGGEADALDRFGRNGFEAFEREGEVGSAFGGDEGVDFVDDDGVDSAEGGGGFGGEEEVEGFGGGDEDVGGMAAKAGPLGLGRVAGADGDCGWAEGDSSARGRGGDLLRAGCWRLRSTSTARALRGLM